MACSVFNRIQRLETLVWHKVGFVVCARSKRSGLIIGVLPIASVIESEVFFGFSYGASANSFINGVSVRNNRRRSWPNRC